MTTTTNVNDRHTYGEVDVHAHPGQITAGGIVLLTARPPEISGTFRVRWIVEGPVRLPEPDTGIALLGATTVAGGEVHLDDGELGEGERARERTDREGANLLRATLDTTPLAVGSWRVRVRLLRVEPDEAEAEAGAGDADAGSGASGERTGAVYEGVSDPIIVLPRPFASGDDVAVTMRRTAVPPTSDQALWVAIRNSTNAIGFDSYSRFIEVVVCGEWPDPVFEAAARRPPKGTRHTLRKVKRRTALPFPNVDRYRLLKAATEVFLMIHCGVDLDDFRGVDLDAESRRLNRTVDRSDLEEQMRDYLVQVATGTGEVLDVLPYLGLIRLKLGDVAIVGGDGDEDDAAAVCYGILAEKLANPCFLELIWSYWHEEGFLVRTLNAISWRFQNRTAAPPGRDPLAGLDIDPLRPLNNLIWGYLQDEQHRLSTLRRAYEYDHHYGLVLASRPGPPVRGADSRSRFVEAFHHLLTLSWEFHRQDDDTTVIADGFGVLNALKEVHLLLTEGAHNQFGDLPWTARHEMLMQQWILSRPEMRDFLASRTMVAHPETWMAPVDAMNKLQGWSDTSILHFRDLGVFGEQLLLSIRFGAWTAVIEPEQAANWARYFRAEIQGYIHAYRAVTGVDLVQRGGRPMAGFQFRRQAGYRG
jgi:hypothetical protein